jgi:plastocyanin
MRVLFSALLLCCAHMVVGQTKTITMTNYSFQPSHLTVTPGTKVTWVNKANTQHTSTSGTSCKPDGKWNSGNVDPEGSFSYTFDAAGTYSFFCIPHCSMGMTGVIEVTGNGPKAGTSPEKKNDTQVGEDGYASEPPAQDMRPAAQPQPAGIAMVNIDNYSFEPADITVPPGTKVTWHNRATTVHTTTSGTGCAGDGKWNSGNLDQGASYSYTFETEGTYSYFCIPHCSMGMTGMVHVKAGAAPPTGQDMASATPARRKKGPVPGFKSLDIINAPSTYVLGKNVLDFSIYHRFDDISGPTEEDRYCMGSTTCAMCDWHWPMACVNG